MDVPRIPAIENCVQPRAFVSPTGRPRDKAGSNMPICAVLPGKRQFFSGSLAARVVGRFDS